MFKKSQALYMFWPCVMTAVKKGRVFEFITVTSQALHTLLHSVEITATTAHSA